MFNLRRGEKGFTLIEIMVVLVILGVLATISVPVYTNSVRKAKMSEAISNVGSYGTAIRIYRMEKGDWPPAKSAAGPPLVGGENVFDIDVNEKYFELTWDTTLKAEDLTINITATDFDATGNFMYVIDAETLKGSWDDGTAELLENYAPYVL